MGNTKTSTRLSNRALKRLCAYNIARCRFVDSEQKRYDGKLNTDFVSRSYVTVKPRAKVTDSRNYYYNKGDYRVYNVTGAGWRWCDKVNNL